jgi:hypothetical protein
LAWHIGCTVEELGERMSAAEFEDWLVFMDAESIGPGAELDRWARSSAIAANGALTKADKSMFQISDFMPRRWAPRAPPAAATTGANVRAFVHALRAQTSLN